MKNIKRKGEIIGPNILSLPFNQRGMALVIALMILVMVTALGLTAIMSSSTEVQLGGNERVAAETLYAADAGIQHALRALRGQNFGVVTAAPQPWLSVENFNGIQGLNYFVNVTNQNKNGDAAPANSVFVTSTATYPAGGGLKIIEAEVRNLLTLVSVNSSLGIVGNDSEIKFDGGVTVNGDLPVAGNPLGLPEETPVNGNDCAQNKAGVAVDTVSAFDKVKVDGGGQTIIGNNLGPPSVQLRPSDMSATAIQALSDQIATNADRTYVVDDSTLDIDDNVTWGTDADPQVTVFSMIGDDSRIRFDGTITGSGILIINSDIAKKGRIEFGEAFTWNGIVIITGSTRIEFDGDAGTAITGGIVIANTAPNPDAEDLRFRANGDTIIQYSCTAVTNAVSSAPLSLNAWHEIL